MACLEMYNSNGGGASPRISFSNDFVEIRPETTKTPRSSPLSKQEGSSSPSENFEFSVSNYTMMPADELFSKGKLLPYKEINQGQRTLREELLVDDDEEESPRDATNIFSLKPPVFSSSSSSKGRWKGLLGLKRAHVGAKNNEERFVHMINKKQSQVLHLSSGFCQNLLSIFSFCALIKVMQFSIFGSMSNVIHFFFHWNFGLSGSNEWKRRVKLQGIEEEYVELIKNKKAFTLARNMFAFRFLICYIYVKLRSWKSFKNLKNQALVCYLTEMVLFHQFFSTTRVSLILWGIDLSLKIFVGCTKRKRERESSSDIKFPVLKIEVTHMSFVIIVFTDLSSVDLLLVITIQLQLLSRWLHYLLLNASNFTMHIYIYIYTY